MSEDRHHAVSSAPIPLPSRSETRGLTVLLENLPLARINVPQSDVDQSLGLEDRVNPAKLGDLFLRGAGKAEEEGDWAAVKVARGSRQGGVDVLQGVRKDQQVGEVAAKSMTNRVRIDPDERGLGVRLEGARNGSHGLIDAF